MFNKIAMMFSRRKASPGPGNANTGDLSLTNNILHIERTVGNLVFGAIPGLGCYFTAKVFATPSKHRRNPFENTGINDGRIARLWISEDPEQQTPTVLYEMGQWVARPTTAKEKTAVAVLVQSWA